MEEYPSNSHKPKNSKDVPEKKINKVVTGHTRSKKKSGVQKFTSIFISEDAANVKSYILLDVLLPAFKKAISDIVTNGVDMILYGESGRSKRNSTASKISYSNFYNGGRDRHVEHAPSRVRTGFDYDDIIFENRGDAEAVLTEMENVIDTYGMVSIGDLYDLADVSTSNYAIHRYGWTNLSSASVVRAIGGGYLLKLPKAIQIN